MKLFYAKQPLPRSPTTSIFLAGPTPRSPEVLSWRPEAISLLAKTDFALEGVVFTPEPVTGVWVPGEYEDQVEWEDAALHMATCILFWIPRDMVTMPAFTTNVEFGMWYKSGKVVFGYPPDAPAARKNKYLEYHAKKQGIPIAYTLAGLIAEAVRKAS